MTRVIKADSSPPAGKIATSVLNLTDIAVEARGIILDARKQAARIVADARQQSEQVLLSAGRKAYAEGFARGQNDGYNQGLRQASDEAATVQQADVSQLGQTVRSLISELTQARQQVLEQARQEMLSFAMELARKIVVGTAGVNTAVAQANLDRAIELAQGRTNLSIKVSPKQADELRAYCRELLGDSTAWQVIADEDIGPGGVKIETATGEIDASIETQWNNIVAALLGSPLRKQGDSAGGTPAPQ